MVLAAEGNRVRARAMGRPGRLRLLLASTSVAALLVGGGMPAALAAGCDITENGVTVASVTNSAAIQCIDIANSTVTGNVSNAVTGVITANGTAWPMQTGILIDNSTVRGAIINNGAITAIAEGISVVNNAAVSGGITSTGTISAAGSFGIYVTAVTTFAGGISNSGTLSAGRTGIFVLGDSTFTGGIANSGTIAAVVIGIGVGNVLTFAGGVGSSGTIAAGNQGISIGNISAFTGGVANSGTISTGGGGILVGLASTFAGGVSNSGTIVAGNAGIGVANVSAFTGGVANSGTITAGNAGIGVGFVSTFAGGVGNSGAISAGHNGIIVTNVSTFTGGVSNGGTISAGGDAIFIDTVSNFAGGITNTGSLTGATGISLGFLVSTFSGAIVNSGNITGTAGTAINVSNGPTGIVIDQEAGTITGAINLSANDTVNVSGGAIAGNVLGGGPGDTINFALGAGTFTYGSAFRFSNISQVNVNSGTVILNGINQATAVTVSGGALEIGDAADPGATLQAVNVAVNGGLLAGTGTIDPALTAVTINTGGMLEPGPLGGIGTLTIGGSLTFSSGSFYDVSLNDTAASKTLVNGAPGVATINGGTVIVTPQFALGAHGGATYAIITAANGRSGTFSGLTENGYFTGTLSLSYDADDAFLNVGKGFEILPQPTGGNLNQRNVASGINNAILAGDTIPAGFQTLAGLSGAAYLNALSELDGKDATGAQTSAFQLMNEFLNLLLDPSSGGGGGPGGAGQGGALGFAPDRAELPPDVALAYASILKAPPQQQTFVRRWTAWGAGFGGSSTSDGNAAVGSSNITASTYGFAAGMDYRLAPGTVFGFALAGAGTNWGLAQGLGSGRSDAFQAGLYGKHYFGPAYVSGALAFGNNWFTTNRTALGDQLTAKFAGQSYAARLEGGYRFGLPTSTPGVIIGVTPYAALQTQWFQTPAYSETALSGGGFGLSYNAMNANDTRSELGARFDDLTVLDAMPLILSAKVAWAHDWVSNTALNASFQTLPGSSFTVFGAPIPHDSALTSAGAELHLTAHWSALAQFNGDFAPGAQTYAGTGTLRYTW